MHTNLRSVNYNYIVHQKSQNFPYLLLLHGFMGSSESFEDLLSQLQTFCNPITIDLIGHGLTEKPEDFHRYHTEEQINDLKELLIRLDLDKIYLLGYSMGGRLALQFAVRYPQYLSGLILESTTYGIDEPREIQKRLKIDHQRAQEILDDYEDFLKKWNQGPLFKRYEALPPRKRGKLEDVQKNQDPRGLANSLLGFGTAAMPSVHNQLNNLTVPALILAGEEDKKFTRIGMELNRRIKNSSLNIFTKCGHRIHLEQPDLYLKYIESFITLRN